MKRNLIMLFVLLVAISCTTFPGLTSTDLPEEVVVEAVQEAVVTDDAEIEVITEVVAVEVAEEVAEEPPKPEVTKQQILDAIDAYDIETLTSLLEGIDDVKTVTGKDVLLLHRAEEAMGIGGQKNAISELLIGKKAYLLQKDENGRSFERLVINLEMAATPRHEYIIEVMGDKYTRLSDALRSDSLEDIKAMEDFLPLDANLLIRAAHEKAPKIAGYVLASGVDVNSIETKTGETALHKACNNSPYNKPFDDRIDLIQTLFANGANVNLKNKKGDTPFTHLFLAIQKDPSRKMGSPEKIITLLIENNADVNQLTGLNHTPLSIAAGYKLDSIVELLVNSGAVIDEETVSGLNNSVVTMKFFIENGIDSSKFVVGIQTISDPTEKFDFVKFLLSNGLQVDDINLVFVSSNIEILEFLIDKGADINQGSLFSSWVSANKSLEQIKYLVENGASPARPNRVGKTALHYAVRKGNLEVATYLLELGVDINAVDDYSKTPLDYYEYNNPELNDFLVSMGAIAGAEL